MDKLRQTGRIVISLLFAMVITFCCVQAVSHASTYNSLTGYSAGVGSITVSGGTVAQAVTPVISGDQYTWNIQVTEDWASLNSDKKITITFTKDLTHYPNCEISTNQPGIWPFRKKKVRDGASLVYEATIDQTNLNGSATAYVYYDLDNHVTSYKTYVFNVTCSGALNPRYLPDGNPSADLHVKFGDPAYPDTEPECDMKIVNTNTTNTYSAEYAGGRNGFYPDQLALYVKTPRNASITATTNSGDAVVTSYGSSDGYSGFLVDLSALTADSAVQITDGTKTIYLVFHKPAEEEADEAGTAPTSVVSYLPIGQFATGSGWGTSTGKFVGTANNPKTTPESVGVSLGAFGGYIEYYFEDGIPNSNINSYGVDFMIYGNAFNGNPEAGAVQVSHDGKTWYELAGSLYYEDGFTLTGNNTNGGNGNSKLYTGTRRNSKVVWTKGTGDTNPDVALYPATGSTSVASFSQFGSLVKYPSTSTYPMGGAHDNTGNMSISFNASTLTFPGITVIEDSDSNGNYGYGYCDITPNGSPAKYGTAVNPYEVYTTNKTGGDGFDLEWITDISTGEPVSLSTVGTIYYVRVYSAVMHNAGVFGETSAEVTGIFLAANAIGKTNVGRTSNPSYSNISLGGTTVQAAINNEDATATTKGNVRYVTATDLNLSSGSNIQVSNVSSSNVFINNEPDTTFEYNGSKYVRIVVQEGYKAPSITVIKLKS